MRKLNQIIMFSLVLSSFNSFAQTKEIFWKSHSGSAGKFNPNGKGDLGIVEPEAVLIKVEKVNDSSFVKTFQEPNGKTYTEKSVNEQFWMQPKTELDSLVSLYYPDVKLIGFDAVPTPIILHKIKKEKRTARKKK